MNQYEKKVFEILETRTSLSDDDYHEILDLIQKPEFDINVRSGNSFNIDETIMHHAISKGFNELVNILITGSESWVNGQKITKKSDITALDQYQRSVFSTAMMNKNYEAIKVLIKNNVDLNEVDENGRMPIHVAILNGDLELLEILLKAGVNPNTADSFGRTPLCLAFLANKIDAQKMIIASKGFDINTQNNEGQTILHTMLKLYNHNIENAIKNLIKYLYESNNDIDVEDDQGKTPFSIALERKTSADILNLLFYCGTKICLSDVQLAKKLDNKEIEELINAKIENTSKGRKLIINKLFENIEHLCLDRKDGINKDIYKSIFITCNNLRHINKNSSCNDLNILDNIVFVLGKIYFDIWKIDDTKFDNINDLLKEIFTYYSAPSTVKTDNGILEQSYVTDQC